MMESMKNALLIVGFLAEAIGLALTATGLWRTWKANTDGSAPLWPWVRRSTDFLLYRVLRRQRPPVNLTVGGSVVGHVVMSASGYGHQPLKDEMTVTEKFETVQANSVSALKSAAEAHGAIAKEKHEREQAQRSLERRVAGAETDLKAHAKRLVADGIPLAIGGLAITALGLFLQALGNLV